jgi:hypothetical protein
MKNSSNTLWATDFFAIFTLVSRDCVSVEKQMYGQKPSASIGQYLKVTVFLKRTRARVLCKLLFRTTEVIMAYV